MDLTNEEALEAFQSLVAALRAHNLAWVVTQVEEKLALGKVQPKKIRTREVPEFSAELWEVQRADEQASGKKSLFAVAEPYSSPERLDILLESISLAVPMVNRVANQVFDNLSAVGIEGQILFEPEAEVSDAFSLTQDDISDRAQSSVRLLELIAELRGGSNAITRESAR